jgi:plastocyanin
VHYAASNDDFETREMPAAVAGANPHLAAGTDGPVAAWYAYDTTSLAGAILTEESPELAVPSPDAEIGGGGGGGACEPEEGTELTIAAPPGASGAGFDKDCLAAPAGEAFTVAFANDDEGIPHNWTVYADESAQQSLGGAGGAASSITGPDETTYDVEGLEAGEYFFQCDLHPSTMVGTFIAAGEGGSGEEGGASPEPTEEPAGGQSPGAGDPTPTTTPSG